MTAETRARRRAYQERKNRNQREGVSLDIEKGASFVIGTGEVAESSIDANKLPLLSHS